ncbi:MAG: hypothetical protein ISP45_04120 [Reyranella sp.]|nr:hypothetical protein [Reyranella sp.]MBL6851922.1 hypothetical protein [Alphaproteobacteria bacterium]
MEKRSSKPTLISAFSDSLIIETVYRPQTAATAFVIARGRSIETAADWRSPRGPVVPVSPRNNLIAHGAIHLPSRPTDSGTVLELATDITTYLRRYVSLDEDALRLCASYALLTWMFDAFNELPYLRFRGDYGTGKTRALQVLGSICNKAFFASGASTISPIFHVLDTFRGTLVFDEADFRFSDEKAELVKILNNGNARGFPVLRTHVSATKVFDPVAFDVYGPKIVAMRRSYDDRALESRFLTVEMEPGRVAEAPINLPAIQKEEALELRNRLLTYRLRWRRTMRLAPQLAIEGLEARMNQIVLPLLSVAPPQFQPAIRDRALAQQRALLDARALSSEGLLLSVLNELLQANRTQPLTLNEIAKTFAAKHAGDYERPIANRWVGAVIRRLGIQLYKSNGITVLAPNQNARIAALCVRHGVAQHDARV